MKAIDAVIEIKGSQQEVWDTLADFDSFQLWNPYLKKVKGKLELEKPLDITFAIGGRERRVRGRITLLYPPNELQFEVHFGVLGMLTMEHTFHVESFGDEGVCFVQRQTFSGPLATAGRIAQIAPQVQEAFEAMNHALKERVESKVRSRAWLG